MKTHLFTRSLLALVLAPLGWAQITAFEGAVFYEHSNYGGNTLTLYPGEGIPSLRDYSEGFWATWNDKISSIAVWGNVVVYLYADSNYRGEVIEIRDHIERLAFYGWNDRALSVWVDYAEPVGWYWDTGFDNWVYADSGDWLYVYEGLGWIYGGFYDTMGGAGWIWDPKRGWLWLNTATEGWFVSANGTWFYYLPGSHDPRWWYSDAIGWFND